MTEQSVDSTPVPSDELASFVSNLTFNSIPDKAVDTAERCFVDTVAVALAGSAEGAGARAIEMAATVSDGNVSLFGTADRASVTDAAFANSTAAHALDFDDDQFEITSHPSATMVPPILALAADRGNVSGRDAIRAYVAGFETQYYVSQAITPSHYERGWHATSTFGTFGATASAASILGLDKSETRRAFNIAASTPAGIYRNFGTMTKPMHAGQAARSGVTSALLARRGFTAAADAISGQNGFFELYAGDAGVDLDALPTLGERWALVENGIYLKKYPCCYATHNAIEAATELQSEFETSGDVDAVRVFVSPGAAEMLTYSDPTTGMEAKFSLEYCVASALSPNPVELETFDDVAVDDPTRQRLLKRVEMVVDEDIPYTDTRATVELKTVAGDTMRTQHMNTPGSPANPLTESELRQKFNQCLARADQRDVNIYDTLRTLRTVDVNSLIEKLP